MNLYKFAELYLKAALKLPEWAPDWVKSHPDIQKVPETIEKDLKIKDYEESINVEIKEDDINISENNEIFSKNIKKVLSNIITLLDKRMQNDDVNYNKINYLVNLISLLINNSNFNKYAEVNRVFDKIETGKYKISLGQSFTSAYLYIINEASNFLPNIENLKNLKNIEGFKKYSPTKNKKYTLIFSTNPHDILRMSSSNNWTSCMDIFKGTHKHQTIGATLAKNIGIIYLTDKENYENRGYKMIYRSLVKLIVNIQTDEEYLYIDRCYPDDKQVIKNIFKESLSKKYPNVLTLKDIESLNQYNLQYDENYDKYKITQRPYADTLFGDPNKPQNNISSLLEITDPYDFGNRLDLALRDDKIRDNLQPSEYQKIFKHIFNNINDIDDELISENMFNIIRQILRNKVIKKVFHRELKLAPTRVWFNFSTLYDNYFI